MARGDFHTKLLEIHTHTYSGTSLSKNIYVPTRHANTITIAVFGCTIQMSTLELIAGLYRQHPMKESTILCNGKIFVSRDGVA